MINLRNALMAGGSEPAPAYWGLCFTAVDAPCEVQLSRVNSPPAVSLEYSLDGISWAIFVHSSPRLNLPGDKLYVRAGNSGTGGDGINLAMASSYSSYCRFDVSARCALSGDISSILNRFNTLTTLPDYAFCRLFSNGGHGLFTSAPTLPATKLGEGCYRSMFANCSYLTTAELAATSMDYYGIRSMFQGCTSLSDITVHFSKWPTSNARSNWVYNVAASGTFRCPATLGTNETITRGTNNCPSGWTVVNT